MTDITELAQRMKAAAGKATQGEWWADEVKNEGCYGSGDDCVEGFTSYAIYGSDGQTLFDSLNSDAACICEEYDGEGHVAWDETAQRNAEFIALANPANILALVEALEKAQQVDEELCKLLPPGAEYMDPPDGGNVTPLEGVRRMVADYRQRIAELESHKAALLKFVRDSCYVFDGTDEDISDAYVDAITSGLMPKLGAVASCNPPLFWVRVKSDGGYEGPVHDSQLEEVRKKSGEWLPLTLAIRVPELESRTVKLPDGWQFEECEIEGCENGAIFSVGTGSRNIHLCDKCAHEPQNSRLKKSPLSKRLPFKMSAGIKVEAE
ncbi:ead/Ea22-like family protein [Klebsiella pneumoniae]|uniref:ead/Ea22-like family protein n=1 Tax=Klebsiella pneumoniae TaxID=573 RepID=UPI00217DF733|nr:ead/Ea22-like family protein [Klebsiella pneumoniae]MCS5910285.1 ead/Ea22-like family protein [Klebsiella pneumoniae subsp. pneumoniae]HBX1991254.1 ead/Ea22-like family protein [Klebsiella pneumoniae]